MEIHWRISISLFPYGTELVDDLSFVWFIKIEKLFLENCIQEKEYGDFFKKRDKDILEEKRRIE